MKAGGDDADDYVEVLQTHPPRSPSLSIAMPRCRLQAAKADEDSDDEMVVVGDGRQHEEREQMDVDKDAGDEDEEEEGEEEGEDEEEEDGDESEEEEEDSTAASSVSADAPRKSSRPIRAASRYSPQIKSSRSSLSTSSRSSSIRSSASSAISIGSSSSSGAALSASTSSTSESGVQEYGRGKRQVKARVITIDGYPVMLENNYRLKGEIYEYASDSAEYISRQKQPSVKSERDEKKAQAALKPRAPPKQSEVTKQLLAHNESVRRAKEKVHDARTRFLVHNLDVLEPFLEPKILKSLRDSKQKLSAAGVTAAKLEAQQKVKSVPFQPEYIVGGELRDYQMHGLSWLIHKHNQGAGAILGDEMGLGKTIQTTAFLGYLKHERQLKGPSLIVCPLSVLSGWMAELQKWCPTLRALRLHTSDQSERKAQCQELLPDVMSYDVCVTTYDMLKNKILRPTLQYRINWNYVIFDEGHCLKNEMADVSDVARKLHTYNMVLLTGTPLQNNLHELWSLLSLLFPDVFTSSDSFDNCFRIGSGTSSVNVDMLNKAHELVKPFMLRRLKVEVEKSLPLRIETRIACPLSEMQSFWYKRLLLKERDILLSRLEPGADGEGPAAVVPRGNKADDWKRLQALWVQLRKCCNHPYLFPGAEPDESEATLELMVKASGKLHMMDRLLEKLKAAGHRVVIFSQYTHMLDIIDDYLYAKGHSYTRLDGSTNRVQRFINIKRFNQPDSKIFCFIMTTRAGGLGVNLQTADTVILFDSDWNPQPDLQAMARVHRIGQTKVVHVYRLVVEGTIEERVVQHSEKKLYLDQMVNRDSLAVSRSMGVEEDDTPQKKDLLEALTFGADRIFKASSSADVQTLSDADLDAIIDRKTTAEDRDEGARLLKADKRDAASFDPNSAYLGTRELQGVLYKAQPASVADITQEWQALQRTQRSRNQRLVMVPGLGSGYGSEFVPVLAQNMYDLNSGESSVFDRELAHRADPAAFRVPDKRKKATAGRDYSNDDYCLHCWDGGDLLCCDHCPAAYHPACLGYSRQDVAKLGRWQCPQHRCVECDRAAHAVGGLLFRCEACPYAYCLDHLPEDHVLLESVNPRWGAMGYGFIRVASYVHCSKACAGHAAKIAPQLAEAARKASGQKRPKTITAPSAKANPSPTAKENINTHAHGHIINLC